MNIRRLRIRHYDRQDPARLRRRGDDRRDPTQRRLDRNFHMLILVVLFLGAAVAIQIIGVRREQARAKASLRDQCQRVQSLRDIVNANTRRLSHADAAISDIFSASPVLKQFSPPERVQRLKDVTTIDADVAGLLLSPNTDCHAAVYNPPYHQKPPIPLSR